VGILMRIEARFRVRLPRAELAAVETVGDLISLVERKQAAQQVKAAA
jgi:acyl carrier protein